MTRFKAIVNRVVKELLRDKRTLALMLIAPIIILALMNVVFNSNSEAHIKIGYNSTVPSEIIDSLSSDKVKVKKYNGQENIKQTLSDDDLDAFITLEGSTFKIIYENEDPSISTQTKAIFNSTLMENQLKELTAEVQKFAVQTGQTLPIEAFSIKESYVYGNKDSTFFDKILPILIGFFVFFFVFLVSGIALLKERTAGTLERLLATPVKRSEIIFGYLTGYGLFAILQTLIIIFYSIFLLNLEIAGSLGWVLITNLLLALVALSMGLFVSTFAYSEFQMVQFIPLIIIPQIFFSGLIPLDTMADWVKTLSYIFPLSYAANALSAVMIKGQGFSYIWPDLAILALFGIVFTFLNIVGLKKYRKV